MLWSMTCKRAWGWLLCDAQDTFDESIRYLCDPPDTSLCLWMHHQGAGGQYFRCHTSWTSRIRLLGSAEQSKLQRTLCKKTWHIANNCIDHFDWAEQHKRRDHDTNVENGKKTLHDTTPDHFTLLSILPLDRDMRCICNFDSSPTPPRNETAQLGSSDLSWTPQQTLYSCYHWFAPW